MRGATTKEGDEQLARLLLRSVLRAEVEIHDDGSRQSMYDLRLTYGDGRQAAAEVVSTRDRQELALMDAAAKQGYVCDPQLSKFWWVQVAKQANLKRLRPEIASLLAGLEQRGVDEVSWDSFGALRDRLDALHVETCRSHEPTTKHPPGFYLWPSSKGAWVGDGDELVRAANDFLPTVPDVTAKLRDSQAAERHAVVVVTVDRFSFFLTLESGPLPTTPPELPDGVDCLWLVTMKAPPVRAVYWPSGGPWAEVTLTAEQLSKLAAGS